MIRLALTKGRIEKTALEYLAKAGYDVSELDEDKKGRKLNPLSFLLSFLYNFPLINKFLYYS